MAPDDNLPSYAPMMAAYHRAYETELREMIEWLPIHATDQVLEVACGDGVYTRWIAERLGGEGRVVALDALPAYLQVAQNDSRFSSVASQLRFTIADIRRLPFDEGTFDFAWCAQSLFSLPDPLEAIREMTRVIRAGGIVAVLENDTLHHVLLPWPIEIELAVRSAELLGFVEESEKPRKFYVGRQLPQLLRSAGLTRIQRRTWALDRQSPLNDNERQFLSAYLDEIGQRARPNLKKRHLDVFERLIDRDSEDYLLDLPELSVTCIEHVVWGIKPGNGRGRS